MPPVLSTLGGTCRCGRVCDIPQIVRHSSSNIKRLREASLTVKGQRLFNSLPQDIRNITGSTVEVFKRALDQYLHGIPDEPQIQGYTALRRADTNSLIDMIRFRNSHQKNKEQRVEGPDDSDSSGSRGCAASVAVA